MNKTGLRIAEILVILLVVIVAGVLGLNAVGNARFRAREAGNRTICASHLKQWATVLAMYAEESKGGLYPPVRTAPTVNFEMDLNLLYPQYLSDFSIVACPSDVEAPPPAMDLKSLPADVRCRVLAGLNQSYAYLGWVFDRMEDVPDQCLTVEKLPPTLAVISNGPLHTPTTAVPERERRVCGQMALTLEQAICRSDAADVDVPLDPPSGNRGGTTVYRLRKGVERMLSTDSNTPPGQLAKLAAGIPVMLDSFTDSPTFSMFMHMPGGSNVLFLDGHVEFRRYPDQSPVNRPVGNLLNILSIIKG